MAYAIAMFIGGVFGAASASAFGLFVGGLLGWLLVRVTRLQRDIAALRAALEAPRAVEVAPPAATSVVAPPPQPAAMAPAAPPAPAASAEADLPPLGAAAPVVAM